MDSKERSYEDPSKVGANVLTLARGISILTGATAGVEKIAPRHTAFTVTALLQNSFISSTLVPTDPLKKPDLIKESGRATRNDAFWSSQTAKVLKSRKSLQPPSMRATGLIGLIGRGKFRPSEPNTHPWLGLEFTPCLPPKSYRNSSFPYLLFCGLQLAHRQLTHTYLPLQGAFACKSYFVPGALIPLSSI